MVRVHQVSIPKKTHHQMGFFLELRLEHATKRGVRMDSKPFAPVEQMAGSDRRDGLRG